MESEKSDVLEFGDQIEMEEATTALKKEKTKKSKKGETGKKIVTTKVLAEWIDKVLDQVIYSTSLFKTYPPSPQLLPCAGSLSLIDASVTPKMKKR